MPALVEANYNFKYVLRFKGAGHEVKVLIAKLISGEITSVLNLKMPELVFAILDEAFGRSEGYEEINYLLKSCTVIEFNQDYSSGALGAFPC